MIGFSLYMIKAMLNGRGGEIIDSPKATCSDDRATLFAGRINRSPYNAIRPCSQSDAGCGEAVVVR